MCDDHVAAEGPGEMGRLFGRRGFLRATAATSTAGPGATNLRGVFVASYTDEPEGGLPPLSGSDEVVFVPTP
jgi:hypothetical protein